MENINKHELARMKADAIKVNARLRSIMQSKSQDPIDYEVKRRSEIISYLQKNPNKPLNTICQSVTGGPQPIREAVSAMVTEGTLQKLVERRGKVRVTVYAVKG